MKCKQFLFLLKFLLISQEPQGLQGSFLCRLESLGPAVSTGRRTQALGCVLPHSAPTSPSARAARAYEAGWHSFLCLWFLRELGQERSQRPPSTVSRPALFYQHAPSWDTATPVHSVRAHSKLPGCTHGRPHMKAHTATGRLEPQCCPQSLQLLIFQEGSLQAAPVFHPGPNPVSPSHSGPSSHTGACAARQAHRGP